MLQPRVRPPARGTPGAGGAGGRGGAAGQPVEMGSGPDHQGSEYLNQDHRRRPHQGLGNRLLGDRQAAGHDPPGDKGEVVCRVPAGRGAQTL